jgi:predicted nucleic acid-binding protein
MARVCVDACFLIGLYDAQDERHDHAMKHFSSIFGEESARNTLVAPWPILYECCGTRQAKNSRRTNQLREHWGYLNRFGQLQLIDDTPYRNEQLVEHLDEDARILSLADRVLRAMILDARRTFDYFLTYNTGDFADACQHSGIFLINEKSAPGLYGF